MANITIYDQVSNQNYLVTINTYSTVMEGTTTGIGEYYPVHGTLPLYN